MAPYLPFFVKHCWYTKLRQGHRQTCIPIVVLQSKCFIISVNWHWYWQTLGSSIVRAQKGVACLIWLIPNLFHLQSTHGIKRGGDSACECRKHTEAQEGSREWASTSYTHCLVFGIRWYLKTDVQTNSSAWSSALRRRAWGLVGSHCRISAVELPITAWGTAYLPSALRRHGNAGQRRSSAGRGTAIKH